MSRGDGGFGDADFGGGDFDGPDLGDPDFDERNPGRLDAAAEPPEGEGPVRAPDEAAEDAVLRHVLDAVRGGDTPDVVPASSSVAGFAEFLAVEAVLDKRWPETRMEPSLDRIADLVELLGDPQRGYPVVHLTGTNGKTSSARSGCAPAGTPARTCRVPSSGSTSTTGRSRRSATSRSTATWRRSSTSSTRGTTCH